MLHGRGTDGMVLASVSREDTTVTRLLAEDLPLVTVNRTTDAHNTAAVLQDDRAGMAALVNHLVRLGHRRIAHLAGPLHLSTGNDRLQGFQSRLAALGLPTDPSLVIEAQRYAEAEGPAAHPSPA